MTTSSDDLYRRLAWAWNIASWTTSETIGPALRATEALRAGLPAKGLPVKPPPPGEGPMAPSPIPEADQRAMRWCVNTMARRAFCATMAQILREFPQEELEAMLGTNAREWSPDAELSDQVVALQRLRAHLERAGFLLPPWPPLVGF